uniref:Uncharacterized protein n=1 Tax=Globisporangium ultimum (strain ATCC 200006 / CBS 805.95 / DAOM BR144) TaxID=431595 RepID=K3X982_GLOUD
MANGKLDLFTVSDSGVREYENLQGGQKMLVEFEYGSHGSGISPSTFSDESWCGHEIIASLVTMDGVVKNVNVMSIYSLPPLDFEDLAELQTMAPSLEYVDDFYESEVDDVSLA